MDMDFQRTVLSALDAIRLIRDCLNILIPRKLDRAKAKILEPFNAWITFKLLIYGYIYYQTYPQGLVAVTLMDLYLMYFPIFVTLFVSFPDRFIKAQSSSVETSGFTKTIQLLRNVGVCIFGVSLFSLFYFEFLPPWDGTPGVGGDPNFTKYFIYIHF